MVIIIGSSSAFTISFSNSASDDAGQIILEEELINLERLVKDKALLIEGYFDQFIAEIRFLSNYAEDLFNGRIPIESRDTYIGIPSQDPSYEAPANMAFSQMQNAEVSFEASSYYVPGITTIADIDSNLMSMITNSSYMDFAFKSIFAANPLYIDAYMGFTSGIYRTYPYRDMSNLPNNVYKSALNGETITGYDPRHTNFYVDGVKVNQEAGNDGIRFGISKPYFNTEGIGLEIAIYQTVHFDNGTLIGVVGTNLTMAVFEGTVNNLKVLDTGYAFLVDHDMNVIVHQDMEIYQSSTSITDLEFLSSGSRDKDIDSFSPILNEMGLFREGQTSFTKNNAKWYISYFPVRIPKFCLSIVISENQILAAADQITSEANDILVRQLILFFFVSAILGLLTIYVIRKTSNTIVEPIKELTLVTDKITQGNLRSIVNEGIGGSREVVLLYQTFRGLVTALRFGNEEYYAGNLKRAMNNYQNALQLFTTMNNIKGVGICYNNIGNIQNALGKLKEANTSYQKAIDIAESLLKESKTEEQRIESTLSLASRTNNVAMLFSKIERYDEAESLLTKALKLDEQINNKKGLSTRYGNLGLNYISVGKLEAAKVAFYKALEIANEIDSNRSIAYAKMNLGIYHRAINENDQAKESLLFAIELAHDLDIRVVITSFTNLKEIYETEGEYELADEIDKKLSTSQRHRTVPREIIFVLDYSGSMHGRRIKDAKEGIMNICINQVQDNDLLSIISFNYDTYVSLESTLKIDLKNRFYNLLDGFNRPYGGTAMYDGIGLAFDMLQQNEADHEQWVIVLTDGDDNSSRYETPKSIIKLATKLPDANLVIIGVGELKQDRSRLLKITKSLTNGLFIGIEAGVENAISEAFEEVGTMLAEVDVEGFVPDY